MHFNEIYIKNNNFRELNQRASIVIENNNAIYTNDDFISELRKNRRDIIEKKFGDISSFNFNREVFFSGNWNSLSKVSRGLFLNNKTGDIVARSYEKFFNYKEKFFNSDEFLKKNIVFPVTAYHKYNGFLGILSVVNNELLFCSKSTVEGDFVGYFKNIFEKENHNVDKLKAFMIQNNCNLVFEVIDHINDPHIVEYDKDNLILLEAVKLNRNFENLPYDELVNIGKMCNFNVKQIANTFDNWNDLHKFIKEKENDMTPQVEGFVLVDANNYHFKLKCKWYKVWKQLRSLKDKVGKNHQFSTSCLTIPLMNNFIGWCNKQDHDYLLNTDIIKLRNDFENGNNLN